MRSVSTIDHTSYFNNLLVVEQFGRKNSDNRRLSPRVTKNKNKDTKSPPISFYINTVLTFDGIYFTSFLFFFVLPKLCKVYFLLQKSSQTVFLHLTF